MVLSYGLGIYIQRVGDRNNDYNVSEAGRLAFQNIFYGFKHPIYRELEYRDLKNKVIYPSAVKEQQKRNLSFSTNSAVSRNQGGDFQLEQKIQKQKAIAPKGIIAGTVWQRISRSLDKITGIYDHSCNMLGTSEVTQSRTIILKEETLEWRAVLRHSKFLRNNSEKFVHNIYGEELSDDLIDFPTKLNEKRLLYWNIAKSGVSLENITYNILKATTKSFSEDEWSDSSDEEI